MSDPADVLHQQRRAAFGPPRAWLRLVALLVALFLLLPSCVVVAMSFSAGKLLAFPPQGFSLEWYGNFFRSKDLVGRHGELAAGGAARHRRAPRCWAPWRPSAWCAAARPAAASCGRSC
jgi:hypothetical protein